MTGPQKACRATGQALVIGAAGIAVLVWTPSGRGESILWAFTLTALVIGVLALTTAPRLLGHYSGPIALAVTGIREQRAAGREARDIEEKQ